MPAASVTHHNHAGGVEQARRTAQRIAEFVGVLDARQVGADPGCGVEGVCRRESPAGAATAATGVGAAGGDASTTAGTGSDGSRGDQVDSRARPPSRGRYRPGRSLRCSELLGGMQFRPGVVLAAGRQEQQRHENAGTCRRTRDDVLQSPLVVAGAGGAHERGVGLLDTQGVPITPAVFRPSS